MPISAATRRLTPVSFTKVTFDDAFWAPRIQVNRDKTLPVEYKQLVDTGRIDAFLLDWKEGMEPKPHFFWDSDVAKWIEAAAYSLATHPDPALDALLDEVIAKIAGAQQPDGYLNVYFTIVEPELRWKNLRDHHELYCAGHLMEAAVAHFEATGKRSLLDVMCRYADYIDTVFGAEEGKIRGYCGHEEIELALVKLYHATGNERYLRLGEYFVNERGREPHYFDIERLLREGVQDPFDEYFKSVGLRWDVSYCQAHKPVREQTEVTGHAVRAMYLYAGMADIANETGDEGLLQACEALWDDVCLRKMYITGGIGPSAHNEGFTTPYDLPNQSAYAETCAAIGLVYWNWRLLQFNGEGRYMDEVERALYNGTISGISLDGEKFFYVNPLESAGGHHREEWFGCACCPPNIARLIASVGGYAYSEAENEAWVHLYASGEAILADGQIRLEQETDYPWDGEVRITVHVAHPTTFALNLRIPGWCKQAELSVDGGPWDVSQHLCNGYARIVREWAEGDVVELALEMPVERVYSHPAVKADAGLVALQRGPIVYCLEQVDNPWPLHRIALPQDAALTPAKAPDLLGGVVVLQGDALLYRDDDWRRTLYRSDAPQAETIQIKAVPYCTWDNREPGEMRVWLREP
jgi:DUF1680 family protein